MDSSELIELFYNRAYEKFVNKQILDDKNYIVPRQQLKNYVHELVNIPYIDFINYIKQNEIEGEIKASDITQFSSFSACEIEMCNALIWTNNPGCQYVDIGRFFPNNTISRSDAAYRRYGECHIKAATQLGLTFEYYGYWYLSCLGYIYPDLDEDVRKQLLARTIIRNRLYQQLLVDIREHEVNPNVYIDILPANLMKKSLRSICIYLEICLDTCKKEQIKTYSLIRTIESIKVPLAIQLPPGVTCTLRTYLNNFDYRTLPYDTTLKLIKKYRRGDRDAYEIIVKGYFRLVVTIAKNYVNKGLELEDLIQEGTIGLFRAIDHFNENINVSFSKYASWWITQSITYALNTLSNCVQLPLNVLTLHKKIQEFAEKYEQAQGYLPSVNDIDVSESFNFEWIKYIYQLPADIKDLTCMVDDFDEYESSVSQSDDFQENENNTYIINCLLSRIDGRSRSILKRYYGIGSSQGGDSLTAIGDYWGLTRERVRQIVVKSIEHLRESLDNRNTNEKNEDLETSLHIVNSLKEAVIGVYVELPHMNGVGRIIAVHNSHIYGKIFILKTEDGCYKQYNENGKLIPADKKKVSKMSPEREAFIKDFYSKRNNTVLKQQDTKPSRNTSRKKYNTNVIHSNRKSAKVGDRIKYDSLFYTVIDKRTMGGFPRLIVKRDDGTLDNFPDDRERYIIL